MEPEPQNGTKNALTLGSRVVVTALPKELIVRPSTGIGHCHAQPGHRVRSVVRNMAHGMAACFCAALSVEVGDDIVDYADDVEAILSGAMRPH